jgi:hypothetical protein
MADKYYISRIQKEYYRLLRSHMVPEQAVLEECGRSIPLAVKKCLASVPSAIVIPGRHVAWESPIQARLRELLLNVRQFWFANGHAFLKELQHENRLYVWPIHPPPENDRYIRRHSLYFDTILKDCMLFLSSEEAIDIICKREHWMLKYLDSYFTLLELEKFALLDTVPPVCVICPSPEILANSEGKGFSDKVQQATNNELENSERSFGFLLDFFEEVSDGAIASRSLLELREELLSLGSINILDLIKNKQLFRECLFESGGDSAIQHMVGIVGNERVHSYERNPQTSYVPCEQLAEGLYDIGNRFSTLMRLQTSTMHTGSEAALSLPYWKLYLWMVKKSTDELNRSLHVSEEEVAARMLQSDNLSWLEAIDIQALVKMRENDGCEELRAVFRKQKGRIKHATIGDFDQVFESVKDELQRLLSAHAASVEREKNQARQSLLWGATSFVVTGGLSLASLTMPAILPLAVASAVATIAIGGKSIRDLINEHLLGKKRLKDLSSRPIALLAEAREVYTKEV